MFLRFDKVEEKILVGKSLTMSLIHDRTPELWQSFMRERKLIKGVKSDLLYSLQVYSPDYFMNFNPANEFTKWAGVEINSIENISATMSSFTLPTGEYAVFLHKGPASEGGKTYHYIFQEWLPSSGYGVDNRPHFELLDERYKNNDPSSEEEIWVPVTR